MRDASRRGEGLLARAPAGLVMAIVALIGGGPITLSAWVADDRVALSVAQESLSVPERWLARAFDANWPGEHHATGTLARLQSARRIGELHGGTTTAASTASGTSFILTLPIVARETWIARRRKIFHCDRAFRSCDLQLQDLSCAMLVRFTLSVGVMNAAGGGSAPSGHRFYRREGC